MWVEDYYPNGKRWWVRPHEKGGTLQNAQAMAAHESSRTTKLDDRRSRRRATQAIEPQGITKLEMAARMKTSRRLLGRLFDPSIPSVTLDTFRCAANAVGRSLRIEFV